MRRRAAELVLGIPLLPPGALVRTADGSLWVVENYEWEGYWLLPATNVADVILGRRFFALQDVTPLSVFEAAELKEGDSREI